MNQISEETRFMAKNKIETIDDLKNFAKKNYQEYSAFMSKRENLWKRYHRAKTKEDKSKILAEINDIQPTIKELRKLKNYCKDMKSVLKIYKIILIILIKI